MIADNLLVHSLTNISEVRVWHVRQKLCDVKEFGTTGDDNLELGEFGKLLLSQRGVVAVEISTYCIHVMKAPLFDWVEIEENISAIIAGLLSVGSTISSAYAS